MKFNHIKVNGEIMFRREEPREYVENHILKNALDRGEKIVIQYEDGSSTVINPEEVD